ncbi:uncharacterized protein L969DRAFT_16242 [Mixia osmundae IAM 14324]|uniref:J domain-containing protein n=1 Tax=Mixia osmundae (strain CBS 9802 / IAM 14324 / JCM 22182 / KY 12970) TaxID=764103 RepID=G7EAQ9_MIXOS|nr:uncharacterized protein L969DRAFT_16242 [Mixia osmundae IAM 14324]KEI40888.1 hypothetical protein L969DRAFT_16242 [Mixia osmundae IAM 14324]GAA99919.1 hypothetical protein E5Q_06622 [Mixia osmundae IAM 14324]
MSLLASASLYRASAGQIGIRWTVHFSPAAPDELARSRATAARKAQRQSRQFGFRAGPVCRDHYQTLGIPRSASKSQIKAQFYKLAKAAHPDTGAQSSADRFKNISAAYAILGDNAARSKYDQTLDSPGAHTRQGSSYAPGTSSDWQAHDPSANMARRARANYAWQHPSRQRNQAGESSYTRRDPFASNPGAFNDAASHQAHWARMAAQEARRQAAADHHATMGGRQRAQRHYGMSHEKAEEEQRLLNDSGLWRYLQVVAIFVIVGFAGSGFKVASSDAVDGWQPVRETRRRACPSGVDRPQTVDSD